MVWAKPLPVGNRVKMFCIGMRAFAHLSELKIIEDCPNVFRSLPVVSHKLLKTSGEMFQVRFQYRNDAKLTVHLFF